MPTHVPIREEDKNRLKQLRDRVASATGEDLSLGDVIGRIVGLVEETEQEELREILYGASEEPPG